MVLRSAPLLVAMALALGTIAAAPAPVSTRAGVYTQAQAAEGARLYAAQCAICHGRMLEGAFDTPGLSDRFIAHWSNAPISNLHDYLGRAMPQFAPGSLSPENTSKIIAFLLQANALPAGSTALPADAASLSRITVEPADPRLTAKAVPITR